MNNWQDKSPIGERYETVTLEKLPIAYQQMIGEELLGATLTAEFDHVFRAMVIKIRGYVWSEKLEHWEIEYPLDWWESFKERWLPAWFIRRYPVRYKKHVIDLRAIYPDLKVQMPDREHRLWLNKSIGTYTKRGK